jgi:uncharacterized protein (TIGR03437 family)
MRWVIFALASTLIGQPFPAPKLIFSKTFGGASGTDTATGVAVDPMGNVAVIGNTASPDFPVTRAYLPAIPSPPLAFFSQFNVANVNLGAAVDVLAMARTWDGSVAYIASDSGIFRSVDGGVTWTQQTPGLAGAVAIGVDGADPNTVYAAVPFPLASPGGYKSTDGGKTWTALNINPYLAFYSNTPISCPNGKGGVVYTSADGLNRSADGGATWTSIGPHHYNVFAFALAPSDANVVYTVASDGLLYRSANGGNTWAAPGGAFTGFPAADANLYVASLAVDPHNENTIWALIYDGNLYRSMDGGATFQIVFSDPYDTPAKLALDPSGQSIGLLGRYAIASFDGGATWQRQIVQGSVLLGTNNGFLVGRGASFAGFLTKFSADGSQVMFSTFLDNAAFVASDSQGNTIVAGTEVRKFDSTGDLIYEHPWPMTATALTVDASGDAIVAVANGICPMIVKLDPLGNTIFSQQTQLCGVITSLAVDASGAIYAAGYPSSALATTPTAFQPSPPPEGLPGFLAILSPAADKINYLSYAGDGVSAMTVDASGNIYLAGANSYALSLPATSSFTFTYPGIPASYAYVMKVNPGSSKPLWIDTFGSPTNYGTVSSLQADSSGNMWFSGSTPGLIPLVAPLEAEGTENSFAAEISADGTQLLFSSYGPQYLALGPQNSVYLAGSATPPKKSATSAFLVKLDAAAASSSVIDSIGGAVQPATEWLPTSLGIAPGEMIRISGRGLGPLATLTAKFDATGRVATDLNGVQALVNGVPAPLISVQATSIVCMTPFEVSGNAQVSVQVVQGGVAAAPVAVGVKAIAAYPDILAVLNPDGTINSQFNPAHPGDTVVVYATGFGDTKPSGQDGALYGAPFPVPLYPVTMYYYENVSLAYAGPAPGIVEGIWQLNLAFSKDAQTGLSNIGFVREICGWNWGQVWR